MYQGSSGQKAVNKYSRSLKGRYTALKKRSKRLGLKLDLTFEEYCAILARANFNCHYCGSKLNPTGSGLDRKDSNEAYKKDNVVACCAVCNKTKNSNITYDEMKMICKRRRRLNANKSKSSKGSIRK